MGQDVMYYFATWDSILKALTISGRPIACETLLLIWIKVQTA